MKVHTAQRYATVSLICGALANSVDASPVATTEIIQVAWDQTSQNDTGSNFVAGGIAGAELAARERGTDSETNLQGVTYFKFDLSEMINAAAAVNGDYSARLLINYDSRLNTINDMGVYANAVATGNTWSNSAGSYPLATWVAPADLGGVVTGEHLIVENVNTITPTGQTVSANVTGNVADWIGGSVNNNGFVLFSDRDAFQGAGFSDARLQFNSVLADYDFADGAAGVGSNFNHPGNDSADTNSLTTASRLESTGVNGGGANNIFNVAGTSPDFNGVSDTGGPVSNWGNGNGADNGNYVSFRITPDSGVSVTYDAISLFHSSFNGTGEFSIRVVEDPDGAATMTDIAVGIANAPDVQFADIDFADFTTTEITEWRIYIFGTTDPNFGFRFDDIQVSGIAVPEPTTLAMLGLGGLLFARRR